MKEDTVLDHVELQLSSPLSSRCELFIAAEGETEKLACGFLKTFLSHLRAAQELHAAGAQVQLALRLEGPLVFNGSRRPWFTKGTLERFVQYVTTPEVLERVKTIEDELAQLEQVRSIQAGNFAQVNEALANPTVLRADYYLGHCPYGTAINGVDNSKRELLKAMDVRLAALQQEQIMAFSRAAEAGFDADRVEDLLAFSEFFGADHLRVACNWFCELSRKQKSTGLMRNANDYQDISGQASVTPSITKNEIDVGSSWKPSCTNASADVRVVQVTSGEDLMAPIRDELATVSPVRPAQLQGSLIKGLPLRTSPRRRSASPLKKVQVGRLGSRRPGSVAIRSINYFSHDRPSKGRNSAFETSSSDSEDNVTNYVLDGPASATTSSPAAARRLSVQAAINLFERKQCKEVDESQGKQRSIKQESRRGSLEGVDTSVLGVVDSRQYGEMGNCSASSTQLQERSVPHPAIDHDNISGNSRAWPEHVVRSPGRFPNLFSSRNANGRLLDVESEDLSYHPGGWQQASPGQKKSNSPRAALNLRRGSSTSEDLLASEVDSVGSSPLARRLPLRHELIDSETSNTASTLTSISQGGVSVDSHPCFRASSSPSSAMPSVVQDLRSESHKSQYIFKDDSLTVEKGPTSYVREEGNVPSLYKNSRNCMLPSDPNLQTLAHMADPTSAKDDILGRNEGRFYEHYRKLRDAKMLEEQHSKRAEREAKLRLMEETLELRKAEMDARTTKLNKENHYARAAKLIALKATWGGIQQIEEDAVTWLTDTRALGKDDTRSDSSPPSPPLTPRAVKEQDLTPNLHRAKKSITTAQKSSTTPRSLARVASVSPKTTPKGTVGKPSSHRSSVPSNITENPLSCSVPCFSDLKKENTKPSPGKPSGSARMHLKNNGAAVNPSVTNRISSLESNGSVPLQNSSSSKAARADRKNHAWQSRNSYATAEFKSVATASEDEKMVVIQSDTRTEGPVFSKIRRSAVAPIQEVRPFLRKGSGIGPGAGPGLMKLKADAVKSSDEDVPGTPLKNSDDEPPMTTRNNTDTSDGENMTTEGTGPNIHPCAFVHTSTKKEVGVETLVTSDTDADMDVDMDTTHHSEGGLFLSCEEPKLNKACKDDDVVENERACHTISFPIDFGIHERYTDTYGSEADSASQEPRVEVTRREETCATLSQLLSESSSQVLQNESSVNGSASFRATLSTDQQAAPRFSPMKAASLASSSLKRLGAIVPDYFSPSTAALVVESPLASPASWNSSQAHYSSETDAHRMQKKSGLSQKPVVMVIPPKEPAKGLKRLLKFGRRSRASPEIIIKDGVSASTPSEGDEDFDDIKELSMHSAQDLLRKVKMQERLLKDLGIAGLSGDHGNTHDKGSAQGFQNSIPVPPSNFKLKYDQAPGSSKLKAAPRSFFSLSTFRSRGSDGKSR